MVETPLPSRDAFNQAFETADFSDSLWELIKLADSWRTGRLVDSEAIDPLAAAKVWHAEVGRRSGTNLSWEASYPDEQADFLDIATRALDAAIGEA